MAQGGSRGAGGSARRGRIGPVRADVALTVGIVASLGLVVAGAALVLTRQDPDGPSCADDWGRLTAAVSAFQADGGTDVSEEALLAGTYLSSASEYFDIAADGSLIPKQPAPIACT